MDLASRGFQTRLNDGAAPGRNGSNLQFVRVDPPDVMAVVGETRRGDGADVAEPEDRDLHALMGASAVENPREDVAIHKTSGGSPKRYTRCLRLRGIYLGHHRSVALSGSGRPADDFIASVRHPYRNRWDRTHRTSCAAAGKCWSEGLSAPVTGGWTKSRRWIFRWAVQRPIDTPRERNGSQLGVDSQFLEYRLDL